MTPEQRRIAERYAALNYSTAEVGTDTDVATGEGFDEVPDGVFVRAWIKVPAEYIPGYVMETSPPSEVVVTPIHVLSFEEFEPRYRELMAPLRQVITEDHLKYAYSEYCNGPAGYFNRKGYE